MTPKQELFCLEYLKDLNATAAYKRAGYKAQGNAAEVNASRLLSDAKVAQRIQTAMNERTARTEVDADRILKEIERLAYADIRKLYREDGSLKLPHEWDDDTAAAMASVEVQSVATKDGKGGEIITTRKVKTWDKRASLELLGRHKKLFTDVVEVKDSSTMSTRMKEARARAKGKS